MTNSTTRHIEFMRKLVSAKRGDRIIYHEGDLAYDRYTERHENKTARPVTSVGNVAYEEYLKGHCVLVQRRLGANKFVYMAIKT